MAQKKVYDKEFKVQAVKLGREIGFSKAAEELGINVDTLYGWSKATKEGGMDLGLGKHSRYRNEPHRGGAEAQTAKPQPGERKRQTERRKRVSRRGKRFFRRRTANSMSQPFLTALILAFRGSPWRTRCGQISVYPRQRTHIRHSPVSKKQSFPVTAEASTPVQSAVLHLPAAASYRAGTVMAADVMTMCAVKQCGPGGRRNSCTGGTT